MKFNSFDEAYKYYKDALDKIDEKSSQVDIEYESAVQDFDKLGDFIYNNVLYGESPTLLNLVDSLEASIETLEEMAQLYRSIWNNVSEDTTPMTDEEADELNSKIYDEAEEKIMEFDTKVESCQRLLDICQDLFDSLDKFACHISYTY